MSSRAFFLAYVAMCLSAATFLVYTEHYGWAWIPFLMLCTSSYDDNRDKE